MFCGAEGLFDDPELLVANIVATSVRPLPFGAVDANVWTNVERRLELRAVAGLARGQVEVERTAVEIGLEVDFGREAAARAAEGLIPLPPLAPAAET